MVSQTEDFDFDPDKTTEDNITRFFGFLSADEPDFAELLLDAVQELTPMPDDANRRRSARAKANQIVLQALDEVEN